jgi:hypothetical protein
VTAQFLEACERHDARRIGALLDAGLDPGAAIDGKAPLTWLIEMYTRSDAFPDCVRALLARGAALDDPSIAPVLLNDHRAIRLSAEADASWLTRRVSLPCAFSPLDGVTPLHVAAELGHVQATRALLALGADVNARAQVDGAGLGGQTPIFHTVNSHGNRSAPVMRLLLEAGAAPDVRVAGLTWGRGFEWETTFFDLTPIVYAQHGLLPQMHRDERHIDENVRVLLAAAGRAVPMMPNVPNRYLRRGTTDPA